MSANSALNRVSLQQVGFQAATSFLQDSLPISESGLLRRSKAFSRASVVLFDYQTPSVSLSYSIGNQPVSAARALEFLVSHSGSAVTLVTDDIWASPLDEPTSRFPNVQVANDGTSRFVITRRPCDASSIDYHLRSVLNFFYVTLIFPHDAVPSLEAGTSSFHLPVVAARGMAIPVYDGDSLLLFE